MKKSILPIVALTVLVLTAGAALSSPGNPITYVSWIEHRIDDQGISGVNLRGGDGLAVADLDGDGIQDVVAVHEFSEHVRISFGTIDPDVWVNMTLASGSALAGGVEDVDIGDVNGDSRLDIVIACEEGHLAYFEAPVMTRDMGAWTSTILAETLGRGSWIRVKLADLDANGQLEILGANKVGPGFAGVEPWTFSVFTLSGTATDPAAWNETVLGTRPTPINIRPVDIDGDGDMDVVGSARTNREIILFENLGGGASWTEHAVYSGGNPSTQGFNMDFADLDGDGRLDIVTGDSSHGDGDVFWLKQPLALGDSWAPNHMGSIASDDVAGLTLVDLNDDGLLDVFVGGYSRNDPDPVTGQFGRLAWFEQPTDVAGPWPRHDVSRRSVGMFDMFVPLDVDGDGLMDLVSTRGNSGNLDGTIWLELVHSATPPAQVFTPARGDDVPEIPLANYLSWVEHRIDDQGLSGVNLRGGDGLAVADLDEDGYPDVVSVHEFSEHVRIAFGTADPDVWVNLTLAEGSALAGGVEDVDIGDVNGDGRLDVVIACEEGHLAYFESPIVTRDMGAWTSTILTETLGRGSWIRVKLADLDANGQLEILGANKVGPGFGGVEPWTFSVFTLSGAATDPAAWNETVLGTRPTPINIRPVDIDGDGDLDVVASARSTREIILYENLTGGTSWAEHPVYSLGFPNTQGFMMEFADLDDDGRMDIMTGDSSGGEGDVFWLKQPAVLGETWTEQIIGTIGPDDVDGLKLVDLNGDGRLDLFVGSYSRTIPNPDHPFGVQCGRLAWFEQPLDVCGPWTLHDVSRRRFGMFDMFAPEDVNRDGSMDLIGTRGNSGEFDGVFWLEMVRSAYPVDPVFTPARGDDYPETPLPTPSSVGEGEPGNVLGYALHQNAPNPFNPVTWIRYNVPTGGGKVALRVYDVRGLLVRTLVDRVETQGEKQAMWNGRNDQGLRVATGTYFFRFTSRGIDQTRKMLLLQ